MASQIENDKKGTSLGTEVSNISYAGVLLNINPGDNSIPVNTESTPVKKDVKESHKLKPTPKTAPLAPVKSKSVPSPKVLDKENKTEIPVESQSKKSNAHVDNKTSSQEVPDDQGEHQLADDDDDFCKVTSRKSKEKRNNADKHSIVPDTRHSRLKKIKRSDSITNDNWRSKPTGCDENNENKEIDPELKFIAAPLPKVNPWMSKKSPATAATQKVEETGGIKEKRVLQPQQQESASTVTGKFYYSIRKGFLPIFHSPK